VKIGIRWCWNLRIEPNARDPPDNLIVIPAKAGIYRQYKAWIPAFAGMTIWLFLTLCQKGRS
jgi:hypothetical protein